MKTFIEQKSFNWTFSYCKKDTHRGKRRRHRKISVNVVILRKVTKA